MNRALTPEIRKLTGLPRVSYKPYPWRVAVLMAVLGALPLIVMAKWLWLALFVLIVLAVVPSVRWFEHREAIARERLYVEGREGVARVVDVEPAGAGRRDHVVRVEFLVEEERVQGVVFGAPLARRGLRPGETVKVVYDPRVPQRCLVVERVKRDAVEGAGEDPIAKLALPPEEVEDDHGHAHKHGGGGCGGGGCGGGGCGGGGCGGGGCGGGGCGGGGCGGGGCGGGGGGCGGGGCC